MCSGVRLIQLLKNSSIKWETEAHGYNASNDGDPNKESSDVFFFKLIEMKIWIGHYLDFPTKLIY